jgi:DNA-binding MarR family transcriptional regulator
MTSKTNDALGELAAHRVHELVGDVDGEAFSASFNLFRLSSRLLHDLEATVHRPRGLSLAGFRVLFTVWIHDQLEPRELARLSGVSRAAVSGVLKTLERDGLVERTREQADRRLVTVRVTESGEALLRETYEEQNRRERQHFASLDAEQLHAFGAVMQQLLAAPLPGEHDEIVK